MVVILLHCAPMALSESQKKHLRGLGHSLKPFMVGDAGLSESVLAEFESTIAHHELVKVKIRASDRDTRKDIIAGLCANDATTLVQSIGNVALLYRANPEKKVGKRLRIPSK
jgi:RNA-binding protein